MPCLKKISRLRQVAELQQFNAGELLELPQKYVDKSRQAETKALVTGMADPVWEEMQVGATKLLEATSRRNKAAATSDRSQSSAPVNAGETRAPGFLLGSALCICIGLGFAFYLMGSGKRSKGGQAKKKRK
eukprot:gnl/TRDRNA2_/TRDRNA2_161649_c0_seq1.p1 gnl/TRDRNA2_/TRDRNA2_161649_c0~~gnl/TRDRNA2_/TRDRNA2_161649_c0_seq1.p1  ORF type:complete len:131 (+),score=29.42 gnl/TRDRNA2_/TRDRNA2_161649_c0_seq1:43-435(+)